MDEFMTEHEQWEALKAWLRQNGPWIVGGVAVGALVLAGWRWWEAREERLALEASARYSQILEAFDRGDRTRAQTLIDELKRDYADSPYVDQADLVAARADVQSGDFASAAQRLERVMKSSEDDELRLIARLRLARVQIAQQKYDDAIATLNAVDPGAFAARYHEVRGDALHAKGDRPAALKEYLAARNAAGNGTVDMQLLELKISDLEADGVVVPEAASAANGSK